MVVRVWKSSLFSITVATAFRSCSSSLEMIKSVKKKNSAVIGQIIICLHRLLPIYEKFTIRFSFFLEISKTVTVPDTATGLQGYQPLVD